MSIKVSELVFLLNGICERFKLNPDKTSVLLPGMDLKSETWVSLTIKPDIGGVIYHNEDDELNWGELEWWDTYNPDEGMYDDLWISLDQENYEKS